MRLTGTEFRSQSGCGASVDLTASPMVPHWQVAMLSRSPYTRNNPHEIGS
jgi:hypothetical protein